MRYGSVALAILASSIGVVLVLASLGFSDILRLVSIPVTAVGAWTLAFGLVARDRYYGIWGGLLTSIGLALLLEIYTKNLLLNFAVALVILPLVFLALSMAGKRRALPSELP